jgi:hypothetical protein
MSDKVEPVGSVSELAEIIVNTTELFSHFYEKRKGRPPKLERSHIKALIKLLKTLVEDIDEIMENLLPDTKQITNLLSALDYLASVKKRYVKRIHYMERAGITPDDVITYKDEEDD